MIRKYKPGAIVFYKFAGQNGYKIGMISAPAGLYHYVVIDAFDHHGWLIHTPNIKDYIPFEPW